MYRKLIEKLAEWKDKKDRLPLILEGARQTGKTWLLKEFGRTYFDDFLYVNCEDNELVRNIFNGDFDIERILLQLAAIGGRKILPQKTLLIFDEIQEIPRLLTSLKYFSEKAPEYAVCSSRSLLGIALHSGTSFPVGKTDFLTLQPMDFEEFLLANGESSLVELINRTSPENVCSVFGEKLKDYLKYYFFVGGMPAVVNEWINQKDFLSVQQKQNDIITAYGEDFSKHAPKSLVPKIRYIWQSVPSQLAKENKKFIYGLVKEGARAKDLDEAIMWLEDCGFIRKVYRLTTPGIPLKVYEDLKSFKLYLLDIGLLSRLAQIPAALIADNTSLFKEFKGSLTEQFVLQTLEASGTESSIFYWTSEANAEVDFVFSDGFDVVPVEAKAGLNVKAKSLQLFRQKFNTKKAIRTSLLDYKKEDGLYNIPLYLLWQWKKYLAQ